MRDETWTVTVGHNAVVQRENGELALVMTPYGHHPVAKFATRDAAFAAGVAFCGTFSEARLVKVWAQ